MRVNDLMTVPARCCRTTEHLGAAAQTMTQENCGCVLVLDSRGHVAGILTDRDICVALAARQRDLRHVAVKDVMSTRLVVCSPEDHLDRALALMKEHRVRRLPVVDEHGTVKGVLSIDDLIRNTGYAKGRLAADTVIDVLRHVCTPHVAPPESVTA